MESDEFAVKMLHSMGKDPYSMKRAIATLEAKYGSDSSFLSSHPSNKDRIKRIQKAIDRL